MNKFLSIISLIVLQLSLFQLKAENKNIVFEKINVRSGLPHNRIHSITKDSQGFMWFGTLEGLSKYDGSKIISYRHNPNKTHTLPDYQILSIFEDKDSILWIGTGNGGLCKYNIITGVFSNYLLGEYLNPKIPRDIRVITIDSEGFLWLGLYGGGIAKFDRSKETFTYFQHEPNNNNSLCSNDVVSILIEKDDIYIGTNGGGLDIYNKNNNSFTHFASSQLVTSLPNSCVTSIFKDSKDQIWVGTENGLSLFDKKKGVISTYKSDSKSINCLSDNRIKSMTEDQQGRLWVATSNGLNYISNQGKSNEKIEQFYHNNFDIGTISSNVLSSLFIDEQNILWIGTLDGGVNQAVLSDKPFKHYKNIPNDPKSLSHSIVRSIFEDKDGNLWVGTDGGGINLKLKGSEDFNYYTPFREATINNLQVLAIEQDSEGSMWFGTWEGGLLKLKYQDIKSPNNKFIRYTYNTNSTSSLPSNIVQDLFVDKYERLWVGTENGLALFDKETNSFINITPTIGKSYQISDKRIQSNAIFQDESGTIWIGTWNGLNKMLENSTLGDKKMDNIIVPAHSIYFKQYLNNPLDPNTLSDNRIVSLFQDKNNRLWVGTYGKGLNRLDLQTDSVKRYSEKDGLINDVVYTILSDAEHNLWMSSNNGLSRFDPTTEVFKRFDENDGLQSNYFYWGAGASLKNGELAFGGTNGLNIFNPIDIKNNNLKPSVYITNILINNKSLSFTDNESPLEKPIWNTNEITLPYKNNQLQFEFVALNYIHPSKNQYAYKLDNFNDEWIYNGNVKNAIYTNLSPGEYTLRVKASNNDGVWNETGRELKIIITPPIYETWWFRTLLFILIASVALTAYYLKIKSMRIQRIKLEKMVDERTSELHEANSILYKLNDELNEVNTLLEETNEEITEQKEMVISQKNEISKKNQELELFRNHLEEVVTERTVELIAAKEKAEESEKLKASFLANMSHEIRTPLNAIVGFSNLLTLDSNTPEEIAEFNDQVTKNTEALLVLIDDILDLSLIEAKQSKITLKSFNINEFLQGLYVYWQTHHHTEKRKIVLKNFVNDDKLFFVTDEHKVRQVLTNFISNAVKFTELGFVEIGFKVQSEDYLFWVKDTGIGIEKKNLDIIFEWFRKIEDNSEKLYRGSGLGLAISIRLSELLGGKVWVDSEIGVGSTFYFSLPQSVREELR